MALGTEKELEIVLGGVQNYSMQLQLSIRIIRLFHATNRLQLLTGWDFGHIVKVGYGLSVVLAS
jgi:hypothetical protein